MGTFRPDFQVVHVASLGHETCVPMQVALCHPNWAATLLSRPQGGTLYLADMRMKLKKLCDLFESIWNVQFTKSSDVNRQHRHSSQSHDSKRSGLGIARLDTCLLQIKDQHGNG